MLDLIVKGGDVVDGTGSTRRRADVAIQGDRIVGVGSFDADAVDVIDATGRVVAPGFIDIHTHFDGQVFWDGALTPSPYHGVTTVIAGNCGFSIAPLSGRRDDSAYLCQMLARVEGIPVESLVAGVPWDWTSTEEYLAHAEPHLALNAGFMVGHSALRRTVMGRDAIRRQASPDEVGAMADVLRAALESGAVGFSSSWARSHNDAGGSMVPSRWASAEEVIALCAVAGEFPGTSLEFIPMLGPFDPWAIDLMASMSSAARRPLNWNVITAASLSPEGIERKLSSSDVARQRGGRVLGLTMPVPTGTRLNFASGFVLDAIPGWEAAMHAPRAERLARLADQESRGALAEAAKSDANPLRGVTDWSGHVIFDVVAPGNEQFRGAVLGEIADAEHRDAFDVLCEIAIADELRTSFGPPIPKLTREDWRRRVDLMRDERTVVGGSDAGAHLDLLATFNYPTVILDEVVRRHGLMGLEEVVHRFTQVPARLYGLQDRGCLIDGYRADLVVFDPSTIATHQVTMRYDLPGGFGRLYAEADGVDYVIVNGSAVIAKGELQPVTPGTVVRSGRDTTTPDLG
jgi:N-acyl-D-aspartate/D-glutamate deacylase